MSAISQSLLTITRGLGLSVVSWGKALRILFCFANISARLNCTEKILYSKCAYGCQFSEVKKRFENRIFGCQDMQKKQSNLFGTPCRSKKIFGSGKCSPQKVWHFPDILFTTYWHPHHTQQAPIRQLPNTFHKCSITPYRHPPRTLQTLSRYPLETFKTQLRHPSNTIKTPSRQLQDNYQISTISRHLENTFLTLSRHLPDTL